MLEGLGKMINIVNKNIEDKCFEKQKEKSDLTSFK